LRLHADQLQVVTARASTPAAIEPLRMDLSRAGRHVVATWRGAFEVRPVDDGGIAPGRLRCCELRVRGGGEQFQRSQRSTPRSLKKQFQSTGVPSWQRDGPLLYADGQLLYAPGLGIDARALADAGQAMLDLRWLPDGAAPA
jgi:tRNA(Ile)-lysidine synthase